MSGFTLGGIAKGWMAADQARNEADKTAAYKANQMQEIVKQQIANAQALSKQLIDAGQTYVANTADRNSIKPEVLDNLGAQVDAIAQGLQGLGTPEAVQAAQGISTLKTYTFQNAKTKGEAATADALSKVQGANTTAAAVNAQAGAGATQPPAAAGPGAPTNIVPPAAQAGAAGTAAPAAAAAAPAQAAATQATAQPQPTPQNPQLDVISQADAASAKPLQIGAGGRVDPSSLEVGSVYTNGKGGYAVWDGSTDQNGQPMLTGVEVQQPINTDYVADPNAGKVSAADVLHIDQSTPSANVIKGIKRGDLPLPPLSRNKQNQKIWDAVMAGGDYNPERYKVKQGWRFGPIGDRVKAFNQLAVHLHDMDLAFQDLHNQGFTSMNEARQYFQRHGLTPGQTNPVEAFDAAQQAAVEELNNAWSAKRGGSQKEVEEWRNAISSIDSPQTFGNTMKTMSRLIMGAYKSQENQYNTVLGMAPSARDNVPTLTPQTKAIFNHFLRGSGGGVKIQSPFQSIGVQDLPNPSPLPTEIDVNQNDNSGG